MKRLLLVLLVLFGCNCRLSDSPTYATSARAVYTLDAVEAEGAYCTAAHIGGDQWLTAGHCAAVAEGFPSTIAGHPVAQIRYTMSPDIGVLTVPGTSYYPALRVATRPMRFGDKVHYIGYPGYAGLMHRGVFEGTVGNRGYDQEVEILVFLDGGGSGSPLLNEDGEIVGVMVSSFRGRPYSYATPMPQTLVFSGK